MGILLEFKLVRESSLANLGRILLQQ